MWWRQSLIAMLMLVLSSVAVLVWTGGASAWAQAFPSYTSGAQIANLTASEAQVTLTVYDDDGDVIGTPVVDTIPAYGSQTYFPLAEAVVSGCAESHHVVTGAARQDESRFVFPRDGCALVVTSDQRLATIVNILSSDLQAGGSYLYARTGATTVYLPLLNKENSGFTTWFTVQNLGSDTANVQVNYTDETSASATIAPDQSHVFYQAQEAHTQPVFAGTVTSDQPVFVSVIQESSRILFAYSGFSSGAINPVFPIINANNAGYVTGLQIQNAGTQTTTVDVTYVPAVLGTVCTETQAIEPGDSNTFALAAFASGANSDCVANERFIGVALVTRNSASQPLIGIGNQLLPGINGEAYGALDPTQATREVVLPLIMDRNSGFYTGFIVQNVGAVATTVDCIFENTSYMISHELQPGQAFADLQQNRIDAQYVGSATCTADQPAARIVAVVNELGSAAAVDQLLVYEGISVTTD